MNNQKTKIPLVSVVMPTYNGEIYIAEAIESILNQAYTNFEFIIVDDGSTDNTSTIITSYNDSRIIYIKKDKNSGIADSLNLGISKAKGKYIARMDDDDVSMPTRLEKQIQILESNASIIVCASNVILNNRSISHTIDVTHSKIFTSLFFANSIVHPSTLIRRSILLKHKYNSAKVPSEDYDLWSRLIWEGQFYKIGEPLLFYRYNEYSETSKRRGQQLSLNIYIIMSMFETLGLIISEEEKVHIRNYASHNYEISIYELKDMLYWFRNLKNKDLVKLKFEMPVLNKSLEYHLSKFLISYFENNSKTKKIKAFFYLSLSDMVTVIGHYAKK